MDSYEQYLYSKPIYRVTYKGIHHALYFELKTLNGCLKRIEREGIEDYEIYEVEKHYCDATQDKTKLVLKSQHKK